MIAFLDLIDDPKDKARYKQLYDKYGGLIKYIAKGRVHNDSTAEDCLQDTLFIIAKNFDKIGDINSKQTKAYVATIANGVAIKTYNKEHRAVFIQEEDDSYMSIVNPSEEFKPDNVEAIDLSMAIDKVLTDDERTLISLRYTHQFKISELSRMYETTDYFINKKINAALLKLKRYMKGDD